MGTGLLRVFDLEMILYQTSCCPVKQHEVYFSERRVGVCGAFSSVSKGLLNLVGLGISARQVFLDKRLKAVAIHGFLAEERLRNRL